MKGIYKIENNYIYNEQHEIYVIWIQEDGILFLKKNLFKKPDPCFKIIREESKLYLAFEGEIKKTELVNHCIRKVDLEIIKENKIKANYYLLHLPLDDDEAKLSQTFRKYQLLTFYKSGIDDDLFPMIIDLVPVLLESKIAYKVEIKQLQSRSCIWKKIIYNIQYSKEYKLYLSRNSNGNICLELSHLNFDSDKKEIESKLTLCNAIWEDSVNPPENENIKTRKKLIQRISSQLVEEIYRPHFDDEETADQIQLDCPVLAENLNHFNSEFEITAEELNVAFKKRWLDPQDIGVFVE